MLHHYYENEPLTGYSYSQGPYVAGNRHGMGELVKADGEVRSENYKEGKLVNFTITKEKNA